MGLEAYLNDFTARVWELEIDPEDGPLRIAVVGLGKFARTRALPAIEETDHCETAVIVSGSSEKAARIAAQFETEYVFDYEEVHAGAGTEAYDAVYIATPPAFHV